MPAGRQAFSLAPALALALALPTSPSPSLLPLALGAFPKVDYKLKALVIAALSHQLAGGWRRETGDGRQETGATSRMPASKRLLLNSPILGIPNDLPSAWLASSFHLPWAGVDSSGVCSAEGVGHRWGGVSAFIEF